MEPKFKHRVKPLVSRLETKPGCLEAALKILGDKWSPLLLGHLVECDKTFSELEQGLQGISPRTLSARLDELESEGVIVKKQYCAHPPRYKYCLSEKGKELRLVLIQMSRWGEKYTD